MALARAHFGVRHLNAQVLRGVKNSQPRAPKLGTVTPRGGPKVGFLMVHSDIDEGSEGIHLRRSLDGELGIGGRELPIVRV